eukprot:UN30981
MVHQTQLLDNKFVELEEEQYHRKFLFQFQEEIPYLQLELFEHGNSNNHNFLGKCYVLRDLLEDPYLEGAYNFPLGRSEVDDPSILCSFQKHKAVPGIIGITVLSCEGLRTVNGINP